jgi:hypothetical protein
VLFQKKINNNSGEKAAEENTIREISKQNEEIHYPLELEANDNDKPFSPENPPIDHDGEEVILTNYNK